MIVRFRIDDQPVPKARPRLGASGHVYTPDATAEYETAVGWAYKGAAGGHRFAGPVAMMFLIWEGPNAGDLDNHEKAISDGLNTVAYEDDVQIEVKSSRIFRKHGQRPHAEVVICDLEDFWRLAPEPGIDSPEVPE